MMEIFKSSKGQPIYLVKKKALGSIHFEQDPQVNFDAEMLSHHPTLIGLEAIGPLLLLRLS